MNNWHETIYISARDAAHAAGALQSGHAYDEARTHIAKHFPWLDSEIAESIAQQVGQRFREHASREHAHQREEQAFWADLRQTLGQAGHDDRP